jgi:hypothetical protein
VIRFGEAAHAARAGRCAPDKTSREVPNQLLTTFLCMTNSIDNTLQVATFKHFLPGNFL